MFPERPCRWAAQKGPDFFSCYIVTAVARAYKPNPDNLVIPASLNCNKRKQRAEQGKLTVSEGWEEGHPMYQVDGVLFPLPFLVGLALPFPASAHRDSMLGTAEEFLHL